MSFHNPLFLSLSLLCPQVVQFLKSPEYSHFRRIVFDTAPTGHTLRLLTLPDFVDASLGKIIRLRQKLSAVPNAIKGFFGGAKPEEDPAVLRLEELKVGEGCCSLKLASNS